MREVKEMRPGAVEGIKDVRENGTAKGKSKAIALLKAVEGGAKKWDFAV
jgi:hypothetical protein